nr:helix-turn-helix domain-containing protein [Methanobrevibacter cuticularis]
MINKGFKLGEDDKCFLNDFVKKSKEEKRAYVLLLLDKGVKSVVIAKMLDISPNTVTNIKKRYLEGGRDHAIYDKARSGQPKKYDIEKETEIIALACTDPPEGYKRWSIRLLAETLREKEGFESITRETVRIILKKAQLNLG